MTQEQIDELRALNQRGCLWLSEMRDGEPWVRNSDLDALLSLAAQAERMREALETANAWLERWGEHVAHCKGGDLCTCGLTAIRHETRRALEAGHE